MERKSPPPHGPCLDYQGCWRGDLFLMVHCHGWSCCNPSYHTSGKKTRTLNFCWIWPLFVLYSHDSPWIRNICLAEKHYTPGTKLRRIYTSGSHKSAPHLKLIGPSYHTIADIPWVTWTTSLHCFAMLFPFPWAQISFTLPHRMLFLYWLCLLSSSATLQVSGHLLANPCSFLSPPVHDKWLCHPSTPGSWSVWQRVSNLTPLFISFSS